MIAPLDASITQPSIDEALAERDAERFARHEFATELLWRDTREIADDVYELRERLRVLEWGETHYQLPPTSSVQGLFDSRTMPYLRAPLNDLDDPEVRRVVTAKGSQLAFTTVAQIWKGWTIHQSPAGMLSIWPTHGLLKRYALTRLNHMLEDCEPLKKIFSRSGLRESDDAINHKGFPGGSIDLVTAGSTSELKSISAERIHLSEVDELSEDIGDQGDPLELARRALLTYVFTSKEFLECTPTIEGQSRIWNELQQSSWGEWHVPCPHCNALQVMRWCDLSDDADEHPGASLYDYDEGKGTPEHTKKPKQRFLYEVDDFGAVIPDSVVYVCVECACTIERKWLESMNAAGDWIHRYPERRTIKGYHLASWYSPIQSWNRCAELHHKGKRLMATRKVFVNTVAGLPYREVITQPEAHFLQARAEVYDAPVPAGVLVLTAGGDVGGDHIELSVWGWGAGEECWLIKHKRIDGDPGSPEAWMAAGEFLSSSWVDADGEQHWVRAVGIDAAYYSKQVKDFCRTWRSPVGTRATHVLGRDGRQRNIIAKPEADPKKRRRSARPSHIVADDVVKDLLYDRMKLETAGPGKIHTPVGTDAGYYLQLTAEKRVSGYDARGFPVKKWTLPAERRNEALDCFKYAYAILHTLPKIVHQLAKLATLPPEKRPPLRKRRKAAQQPATDTAKAQAPVAVQSPASGARRKRRGMISKGVE